MLKMAARNFLPVFTAFFNRIRIASLKIHKWNAMHHGETFCAAIFKVMAYCLLFHGMNRRVNACLSDFSLWS